jgi:hypothetical protein
VGLALLVLVANAGADGLADDALRTATAQGLSDAVLVVGGAIALTSLLALSLSPRSTPRGDAPCPRRLIPKLEEERC